MFFESKKAVVGIGMLLIFIATILVSAIAAGVLIQTTGVLQENALAVSNAAQERLITGIDVFSVIGRGNVSAEKITGLELQARVRAGSPPIQLRNTGISFVNEDSSFSVSLNESYIGEDCQANSSAPGETYCVENLIGNNDTILEEGEILVFKFSLANESILNTEEEFEVTVQPRIGALSILQLRSPELILSPRIRLR